MCYRDDDDEDEWWWGEDDEIDACFACVNWECDGNEPRSEICSDCLGEDCDDVCMEAMGADDHEFYEFIGDGCSSDSWIDQWFEDYACDSLRGCDSGYDDDEGYHHDEGDHHDEDGERDVFLTLLLIVVVVVVVAVAISVLVGIAICFATKTACFAPPPHAGPASIEMQPTQPVHVQPQQGVIVVAAGPQPPKTL